MILWVHAEITHVNEWTHRDWLLVLSMLLFVAVEQFSNLATTEIEHVSENLH